MEPQDVPQRGPSLIRQTIELLHDILKNDCGAGVLRSKYFGANVRLGYPWR